MDRFCKLLITYFENKYNNIIKNKLFNKIINIQHKIYEKNNEISYFQNKNFNYENKSNDDFIKLKTIINILKNIRILYNINIITGQLLDIFNDYHIFSNQQNKLLNVNQINIISQNNKILLFHYYIINHNETNINLFNSLNIHNNQIYDCTRILHSNKMFDFKNNKIINFTNYQNNKIIDYLNNQINNNQKNMII